MWLAASCCCAKISIRNWRPRLPPCWWKLITINEWSINVLWPQVVDYLQFMCPAIPEGCYRMVSLYSDLNSVAGWHRNTTVKLSSALLRQLHQFWIQPQSVAVSKAWGPPQSTNTFSAYRKLWHLQSSLGWLLTPSEGVLQIRRRAAD